MTNENSEGKKRNEKGKETVERKEIEGKGKGKIGKERNRNGKDGIGGKRKERNEKEKTRNERGIKGMCWEEKKGK